MWHIMYQSFYGHFSKFISGKNYRQSENQRQSNVDPIKIYFRVCDATILFNMLIILNKPDIIVDKKVFDN